MSRTPRRTNRVRCRHCDQMFFAPFLPRHHRACKPLHRAEAFERLLAAQEREIRRLVAELARLRADADRRETRALATGADMNHQTFLRSLADSYVARTGTIPAGLLATLPGTLKPEGPKS